jgi:hypothetical protein
MPGQPQLAELTFDVSKINFLEAGDKPTNIVPQGKTFEVETVFDGSGWIFDDYEDQKRDYLVTVTAESLGSGNYEGILGTRAGKLASAGGPYTVKVTCTNGAPSGPGESGGAVPAALPRGIYKVSAVVTFPGGPANMIGYMEGSILQVY